MSDDPKRPILVLLTSHWISLMGVAFVTTAGFSWLFVLPIQLRGHTNNPYIGIVVFILIPVIFVFGLVLIALGMVLARRRIARIKQGLLVAPDRRPEFRHPAFRSTSYVPKCAAITAAASSLALRPCCRKRVSEKKPWMVPG